VNAVYLALQATKINDLLKLVHDIPIQGLSVTMPLKQEILPHLEKTDPLSAKIGACNTVLRAQDGKLYGFNTDVAGITGPLEKRISLRDAKILVLGAGGAARAAVFGLRDKGAEVFILNRTAETAQKLARQASAKTIKKEALAKTTFDAIVNATPIGMAGIKGQQILEAKDLNTKLVFDLVYNPLETPLLRLARQKGIPIITGIEMFVQQGARQFEIFTGKPAPEEEMLRVVIHALRQQAEASSDAATADPNAKKTAAPAKAKKAS
jgi:3-dehydroquinate dehydratase/shikimate dehydrogenase